VAICPPIVTVPVRASPLFGPTLTLICALALPLVFPVTAIQPD